MSRFDSIVHVSDDGSWFGRPRQAHVDDLLREMDQASVERAVVIPLAAAPNAGNNVTKAAAEAHPDRLFAGATVNPAACGSPDEAVATLDAALDSGPYRVLKLHPRLDGYDPLDPRSVAVVERLAERRVPLWIDTLFYTRRMALSMPLIETLLQVLRHAGDLPVLLLHGGGRWLPMVAEAVRDTPTAMVDISYTLARHRNTSIRADVRSLLDHFERRVIFGSDFPEVRIPDSWAVIDEVIADAPDAARACVTGGNLARMLGLSEDDQ